MNILLIHNKYQIFGGEDTVYINEQKILKENNHNVISVEFDNKNINTFKKKIDVVNSIKNNKKSIRRIRKIIENNKIDIIHCHNFFPLISPELHFYAYKKKYL